MFILKTSVTVCKHYNVLNYPEIKNHAWVMVNVRLNYSELIFDSDINIKMMVERFLVIM